MQLAVRSWSTRLAALAAAAVACSCAPSRAQAPSRFSAAAAGGGLVRPYAPGPAPTWRLPKTEVATWSSSDAQFRSVVRRHNHLVEFGPYSCEVDAADGGRIVAFSFEGRSVVLPREESFEAYGSSLWPSPQSDWVWPPPVELDRAPWRTSFDGSSLVLESAVAEKLQIAVKQRITPRPELGALRLDTEWHNRGKAPRRLAPWQNTRVRPGGLTFFPSATPTLPPSRLELVPQEGVIWYQHAPAVLKEGVKAFADGSEGWLAHVDRNLIFVKVFADVPRSAQPTTEAEIELYVDAQGRFVEMEQQGPFVEIAPGAFSTWTVHWLVRRLPPELAVAAGNTRLVEHVRALAKSVTASASRTVR